MAKSTKPDRNKLVEALKEALRVFVLFLASSAIVFLVQQVPGISQWLADLWYVISCKVVNVCIEVAPTTIAGVLTLALKAVDKYLHYLGKEKEDSVKDGVERSTLTLGLTRF